MFIRHFLGYMALSLVLSSCARTQITDSPKTIYLPDTLESKPPKVIWTSRTLSDNYDYLGQVDTRSLTYNGALERLIDAGHKMKADAIVDVHYEKIGFVRTMHAFAIKFRE